MHQPLTNPTPQLCGWRVTVHGQTLPDQAAEMGPRKSLTVLITESSWPASQTSPWKALPCGTCSRWHSLWAHIWQQAGDIFKKMFWFASAFGSLPRPPLPLHSDTLRLKYVFCSCGWVPPGSWIQYLMRWLPEGSSPPDSPTWVFYPGSWRRLTMWDGTRNCSRCSFTSEGSTCSSRGPGHSICAAHSHRRFPCPLFNSSYKRESHLVQEHSCEQLSEKKDSTSLLCLI